MFRALVLAAVLALLAPGVARAQSPALELVSGASQVTVPLDFGEDGRAGRSTVAVRNTSGERIQLRVRYARSSPGGITTALAIVTTSGARRATYATAPAGVVAPVGADDVANIHVRLTARDTPVSRAAGLLILTPERRGQAAIERGRRLAPPLVLPVRTMRAEEGAVVIEPGRVSIPVERLVPADGELTERSGRTSVIVRGDGVESLGHPWPEGVVRRKDGRTLTVHVADEQPAGEGQRRLILQAGTGGLPGAYTGDMVFGADEDPLRLVLTVNVRTWFWGAVLLVFLGALVGQLLPRLLGVRRSRQWLRSRARRTIARYAWHRRRRPEPAGYDLADVIGRWAWDPDHAELDPPDDEARNLLRQIGQARSGEELEAARAVVEAFRATVWRWTRVEHEARRLMDLVDQPLPHFGGRSFSDTRAYRSAHRLLASASTDPEAGVVVEGPGTAATPTDVLVRDLREERIVLEVAVSLWRRQCEAPDAVPARCRLDAIWKPRHDHDVRTAAAFKELLAGLRAADRRLAELAPKSWTRVTPTWTRTMLAESRPSEDSRLSPVRRAWRWLRRRLHFSSSSMAGLEGVLTLLSVAVPCAAYMSTLYTPTWGSDTDLITAFSAGFAGKVLIDWSGLAVFRPVWGWWQARRSGGGEAPAVAAPPSPAHATPPPAEVPSPN